MPVLSRSPRPRAPALRLALAALTPALAGCGWLTTPIDETATASESAGPTSTSTTDDSADPTTGASAPETTSTATTDPTTTSTTGESETDEPPPPPPEAKCALVESADLLVAACAGQEPCPLRAARRLECDGSHLYPGLTRGPGSDAVLYVRTKPAEWDDDQHEAHRLTKGASELAELWVTDDADDGLSATLMPRADGLVELWFEPRYDEAPRHYLPGAAIDGDGRSVPAAIRDDVVAFHHAGIRPDGAAALFFRLEADDRTAALFDLPGDRIERPLVDDGPYELWMHAVADNEWVTWVGEDPLSGDDAILVRELDAPVDAPTTTLLTLDFPAPPIRSVALSPFGAGDHAVVLTDYDLGDIPTFLAAAPWTYEEPLSREVIECDAPTCDAGCGSAPACEAAHVSSRAIGLQEGEASVRAWHLECHYERTVTWKQDSYFNLGCLCYKCFCAEVSSNYVEHPCEIVASELAPDPDVPGALLRSELWRRPLDFDRHAVGAISAVAADDTLWMMIRDGEDPTRTVVWEIDAAPPMP